MEIDGQCHCGRVTYRADIDPAKVSICHCTDCQNLTGSPYRVTVICSEEQVRMTGAPAKIYAKTGDNGRTRFQHFCEALRFPAVHQRRRRAGRLGHPLGQHPPARSAQAGAANLVPLRRAMDQRYQGFAGTAGRLAPCKPGDIGTLHQRGPQG